MTKGIRISEVKFTAAPGPAVKTGLIGWLSFVVEDTLRVDGCTLRRTTQDKLAVSFPTRRDGHGREHPFVHPIDENGRRAIQAQILSALGLREDLSR